jgi:pilus assembly protein CpaE
VVRLMMSFNEMEGIGEKVKIVVNRAGLDNGHITLKKAEETIGKEIFWQLPNEYRTMIEARNNGVPLIEQAPKAAITQSIAGLAAALFNEAGAPAGTQHPGSSGREPAAAAKKAGRGGVFSFWSGKGK